jgi:hypothetical protein
MSRKESQDHHRTMQHIRQVQRLIAMANLPHSYRLFDVLSAPGDSVEDRLPTTRSGIDGEQG